MQIEEKVHAREASRVLIMLYFLLWIQVLVNKGCIQLVKFRYTHDLCAFLAYLNKS